MDVQTASGSWQRNEFNNANARGTLLTGRPLSTWLYDGSPDNGGKLFQASRTTWVEGKTPLEIKFAYHGQSRIAMRKDGQLYYLHGDHLGSTSLTTDSSGKVLHDARYLPYGQVRWESGVSTTDFGFTGQHSEASFGLMGYNARYYNPLLGVSISPDTILPDPTEDIIRRCRSSRHWHTQRLCG